MPAAAAGLALAIAVLFVRHTWELSRWWLLLLPLTFAFVALAAESRWLRARLAEAERQRNDTAAQLDRRISELFSLRELSYVLSESLQLEHIVEQVARYARRFLQAEGAIVVLGEQGRRWLDVVAAEGALASMLGESSDDPTSLVGAAIERGRIEVVQDGAERTIALFGNVTAQSAAVVPLRLRGERIGAIAVTGRSGGPFTTEDLWLLSTVATNASVALANSRLFAIVERGRREWETAFNALREGLAVIGPEGTIQRANSALARLAGLREEELIGRRFRETLFGQVEAPDALIDAAHRGEVPAPAVIRLSDAGGTRSLRLTAAPLASHRPRERLPAGAVVALVEDVTEQHALEAQLFQNEKMAAIGQLVSGVAHELNNPLTSIAGLTELLLERGPGADAPRQHLRVIHEQADRAGRIVRNLLTFVRKGTPEKAPFDFNVVVSRTVMLVTYEMRLRDIELDDRTSPTPVVALGDPNEMQQVLLNLMTNAVQALAELPAGRPRVITVETRHDEDRAVLTVRDTGAGVPPEFVPNLFTPFFTTKSAGKGTGLGLSLSYGLVQAHGGTLSYRDAPEGGAEFTVAIPSADAGGGRAGSRRILVVDEDPASQRVVAALFAPEGFVVDAARGGEEALALARMNDYDLVIADADVPAPAGTTFLRALGESDAKWRTRLLVVGGTDTAEGGRRVSKPFDLRRLRLLADEIIADSVVSSPPPAQASTDRG